MGDCARGHVDPPRFPSGNCKLCREEDRADPEYKLKAAERNRRHRKELRLEAIAAYGGRCFCCSEDREPFLVIDHEDGDGNAHRREISSGSGPTLGAGTTTYRWLKKQGYPAGFQVACANCNMAKERGEICPHRVGS